MPVSSLLLTLRNGDEHELFSLLEHFPSVVSAHRKGSRVALVLETRSAEEARERWEELSALDGVISLNLVYHNVEDLSEVDP
ncbi:MAG: chaperone NapD [Acidobacteriota bacterium]|nr:MAG: chaperone NapD [Acidobacteriota bacterium]